jgi:dTDP-4-dehydrorhamnose 3,5-epimerase
MKVTPTDLPDVLLIEPKVHGDHRGWFMESWQAARYREAGIADAFVQDNQSYSARGTLRGLHIQHPHGQGKLVQVIQGEVFDVAVDVRRGSPHFGHWAGAHLTAKNKHQLWVPKGFVHGFLVLSDTALFSYKCTDLYHPETEVSVRWDDPDIGIDWPLERLLGEAPKLSDKDRDAPCLRDIPQAQLPD